MENALLAAVIAILAAVGVGFTVRHFRGQGGCCGGGGYRPRRKKLDHVIAQKTFRVEGMHCQHCKNRVEEAVGDISGAAARVNLKKGLVTILYAREIDDQTIREKIEKAGYTLTGPL